MEGEDIALLKRISDKEMVAMESFYRRHENSVYRFALKKLNNEFEAAEIVNTVMLEVWNSAARFEGRSKVLTWLIGIAHHRIIDLMRKRKQNHVTVDDAEPILDETDDADMEKIVFAAQTRDVINHCLNKLSGDHKQIIEMLFYQEATYQEMAESIGCSVGTIKSRVHHAKKSIKHCLERSL